MKKTWKVTVTGSVQGVGFRPFVYRIAVHNGLSGFVRNEGGHVTIIIHGTETQKASFLKDFVRKKPPLASINGFSVKEIDTDVSYDSFSIEKSTNTTKIEQSYIPPDIAICDDCINDMLIGDRIERKNYPFTSCVNCGPRFTMIWTIPYDRPRTEMAHFPLCNKCMKEYTNPLDRRFHAQTTCCKACGPEYWIQDSQGNYIARADAVPKVLANLLKEGNLVAIKGIGGTHIACDATNDDVILRLRGAKGDRKQKPFALMADSIETISNFAIVSEHSRMLLTSIRRPIVLLPKKIPFPLSKHVAPGLHNVGVMLPYAGLHVLLFKYLGSFPLIMTSANFSHQPMLKDNESITKHLQFVDYFVLHDRNIHQRADDSVMKSYTHLKLPSVFIRRSRGHVPEPFPIPESFQNSLVMVGCGSELHVTASLKLKNQIIPSQYIGDLKNHETFEFYKSAITHLLNLFNVKPKRLDYVVIDYHPAYLSTEFGRKLAAEYGIEVIPIQHHVAHASSLLLDAHWDEDAIILAADGVGYGLDHAIWGSEILFMPREGDFQRMGHLRYVLIPGGDLATKYPTRMLISYLSQLDLEEDYWEKVLNHWFVKALPKGKREASLVLQQLRKAINVIPTSSMGRLLDVLSLIFTNTTTMTYEGEPAMKLESFAMKGFYPPSEYQSRVAELGLPKELPFNDGQFDVSPMFEYLLPALESDKKKLARDPEIALTMLYLIAASYIKEMLRMAEEHQVKALGFSGGVAYNEPFQLMMLHYMKRKKEITWLHHQRVPPGDGGISTGQVMAVLKNV